MRTVFNSVSDFGDFIAGLESRQLGADIASEALGTQHTNGFSLAEAITCAQAGGNWSEGARNLRAVKISDNDFKSDLLRPQFKSDVIGAFPIVPAFLAGVPDSMGALEYSEQKEKLITISVNSSVYHGVTDEQSLARGRAILAAVEALTLNGYAVELWTHYRTKWQGIAVEIQICIKQSDQNISLASLAFALCSNAFQRRLCFRYIESSPTAWQLSAEHGYGSGFDTDNVNFDVVIPWVGPDQKASFDTPSKACSTIERLINNQLSEAKK